jgi:capsule polysaccharide export protein KpsE/RkpR
MIELIIFFIYRSDTFLTSLDDIHLVHYIVIALLIGSFSLSTFKFSNSLILLANKNQKKAENVLSDIKMTIDELNDFNKDLHVTIQGLSMHAESTEIIMRSAATTMGTENDRIVQLHNELEAIKAELSASNSPIDATELLVVIDSLTEQTKLIWADNEVNHRALEEALASVESENEQTRVIVAGFENIKNELDIIYSKK